jgi:hypothetical protein
VRNRVPGRITRSLVPVRITARVTALVALFMLVPAQLAFAQTGGPGAVPFNFAGPVSIAVAGLGLTGMLLGLWRFRRKLVKDRATATEVMPTVVPAAEPAPETRTPATTP